MLSALCLILGLLCLTSAAPSSKLREAAIGPTVDLSYATVIGSSLLGIDTFTGIPYAQPPVGELRLKPPQPISSNLGTLQLPLTAKACPQFAAQIDSADIPTDVLAEVLDSPLVQTTLDESEDCLTVNVQRPSTATKNSKLPVVFWIFGGGFEAGWTSMYDASELITNSILQGKDIVYVAVNYRIGGFGFLPGKEILQDGSANLGLLDQRLGLQWVADNIAEFGGDPDKVTIWGESAGSISVFDQMALYDGNFTYKGNNLFRAAMMDSGSIVPANPVDGPQAQAVYDTVVKAAGCEASSDTLACLRSLDFETYLKATSSVPGIISYNSLALSYLPRPDGTALTLSPEVLVAQGKFAPVPFIIGDQEDEGTLFSLEQSNITTTDELISYLNTIFFPAAPLDILTELVNLYPDDPSAGSPFRTGILNNIYPQFKRLAAILGDLTFILTRRVFLKIANQVNPTVPSWSYLASYGFGTPVLGTFHATDIFQVYGITPDFASATIQNYYISFINDMDPNVDAKAVGLPQWPQWSDGNTLINFQATFNDFITDNFREAAFEFVSNNTGVLRI